MEEVGAQRVETFLAQFMHTTSYWTKTSLDPQEVASHGLLLQPADLKHAVDSSQAFQMCGIL